MADDRNQLLEEAERHARKGNLSAAAACYRKLLDRSPTDARLLARLGDALARSGQEGEARSAFRRQAELHWKGGLRSRAIAALRRAARLGPPDAEILELLGDRSLEAGLSADAREPLLEAAALHERAGRVREATEILERLIEALPRDLALREQLLRITAGHGTSRAHVRALCLAAEGRAVAGRGTEALEAIAQALDHGGDELPALEHLPAMVPSLAALAGEEIPERLEGIGAAAAGGWTVLRAAILDHLGVPDAVSRLRDAIDAGGNFPARARLWASRLFLSQRMLEHAETQLDAALAELQERADIRAELGNALDALLARNPESAIAQSWKERLAAGGDASARRPRVPAPTPKPPPAVAGAPAAAVAADEERLPTEILAKVVEAKSFLEHRLPERALEALTAIPVEYRERDDVSRLLHQAAAAATRRAESAVTGRTRPEPPPPLREDQNADEEGLVLVLDLDGEDSAPLPAEVELASPEAPATDTPDFDELGRALRESMSDEDAETEYQMAIGLIEMELAEQAAPLLKNLLRSRERAGDAALMLARVHQMSGDLAAADEVARHGLSLTGEDRPSQRSQLLALFAAVCEERGAAELAQAAREELAALVARYPEVLGASGTGT